MGALSVPFFEYSNAKTYADDIMSVVLGYASTAVTSALSIANQINDTATLPDIVMPTQISTDIDFSLAYDALLAVQAGVPAEPTWGSISTDTVSTPTIEDIPALPSIDIPDFVKEAPVLDTGESPTLKTYEAPGAPTVETSNVPDKPAITLPTAPTLSSVTLPSVLTLDLPTFDETLVLEDLLAPSNTFSFDEQEYSSTLKDAVTSGLLDEVLNGGYGLNSNDETLLFDRQKEREINLMLTESEEARRSFAASGFTMPPGALQKTLERARGNAINKISTINRDQTIRRSELYWEGKKFTYTQAIALEQIMINLHNATQERALNAAVAQVRVAIDIFNAEIAAFNSKIERYRVLAEVFRIRIQGEIAKVEIYKAQIEGAKLEVDMQEAQVRLYVAQLEGVKTLLQAYKTDVEAAEILMNIERLKIEVFKAETEAFVAQVQSEKIKFEAYEAKVKGEIAKVSVYEAEARAYSSKIEGKKVAVDAARLLLQEYSERNKALIDVYTMQVTEKNDIRDAQKANIDGESQKYRAQISGYEAEMRTLIGAYDLGQSANEKQYRTQVLMLQQNIEAVKVELQKVVSAAELQMESMKSQSDTYRSLAASALSAMNVNTSLTDHYSKSYQDSDSHSYRYSDSNTTSAADDFNEVHMYHH